MKKIAVMSVLFVGLAACSSTTPSEPKASGRALPQGSEAVTMDPGDFTSTITNPYWPMKPGTKWVYEERDEEGVITRIETTVTTDTRLIAGIEAIVVHDLATEKGVKVEDTYDWYAQDSAGNIWYLGEDTKAYEKGKVASTEGSWEHGVNGALAGIALPADPVAGLRYRQEYLKGEAEDNGRVLAIDMGVEGPTGKYKDVLMTSDTTPLEPDIFEYKFYAKGVGPVLELMSSGGGDRAELVSVSIL